MQKFVVLLYEINGEIIMKKAILKLSFVIAVIAAAGYTAYESQTSNELNGLALDNVEAIASGEDSSVVCADIITYCSNGALGPYMSYSS